jgi:hypothetical protein
MGWMAGFGFQAGTIFFPYPQHAVHLLPAQTHVQLVPGAISPGVKLLGHEVDNSPPSNTEVKNGGDIPPHPPCLHGTVLFKCFLIKRRDNFTFTLLINQKTMNSEVSL